jgi:SAM-dependent methyltransferase
MLAAPPGEYVETVQADATVLQADLVNQFDVVVSWQVLEHVSDLRSTTENIRRYLKPGGLFVAVLSGTWSAFGIINRILPHGIAKQVVEPIMHRRESNTPVFPAYYDQCYDRALRRILTSWAEAEVYALYRGANYFSFAKPLLRAYIAYENFIERRGMANLATHYMVTGIR